jgi:hypothetical protein
MLVRVSYTEAETLGSTFDENQNCITQHLQYEDWAEFMVIWRKQRLELYEDYVSTAMCVWQYLLICIVASRKGVGHKAQKTCICGPSEQPPEHKVVSIFFR